MLVVLERVEVAVRVPDRVGLAEAVIVVDWDCVCDGDGVWIWDGVCDCDCV